METATDIRATSQWIRFFENAGLPTLIATNYAIIFQTHRITNDMIPELTKDLLLEMGIKTLGDVIRILKHCKVVHSKMEHDKILKVTEPAPTSRVAKISAISRLGAIKHPAQKPPTSILQRPPTSLQTVKRRNIISLKRKAEQQTELPKKARRVPPEEEGAYVIKMPEGKTARSRKILKKQASVGKTSVFDRLGESAVTSTSDVAQKPAIRRILPSATSVMDDMELESDSLAYAGILKRPSATVTFNRVVRLPDSTTAMSTSSVKTRLGGGKTVVKTQKTQQPSAQLIRKCITDIRNSQSPPSSLGTKVTARLGTITITKDSSVFNRLGR